MVKKIREQITRYFKILVTPKDKNLEGQYAEIWFPATRNENEFD